MAGIGWQELAIVVVIVLVVAAVISFRGRSR